VELLRAAGNAMHPFRHQGTDVRIYPAARILGAEHISLGAHVIIDDFVFIGQHQQLIIGNYVHVAAHASITGGGRCIVADFAGISSGARILTGTDDFLGGALTGPTIPDEFRQVERGLVVLETHALIGANAVVLPNVTIGEGAAVGAGSVVTRSLAPWTIYAGAPARPVKPRPKDTILRYEQLLFAKYGYPEYRVRSPFAESVSVALHPAHDAATR
jgi:galactoside O-acetyltransferase